MRFMKLLHASAGVIKANPAPRATAALSNLWKRSFDGSVLARFEAEQAAKASNASLATVVV